MGTGISARMLARPDATVGKVAGSSPRKALDLDIENTKLHTTLLWYLEKNTIRSFSDIRLPTGISAVG